MADSCKLEDLTKLEQEIIKKGSTETLNYLLRACGTKGFYESKTGFLCYPVSVKGEERVICVKKVSGFRYEVIHFLDGRLFDYSLEINNGLLPKDMPTDDTSFAGFLKVESRDFIIKMELNGRVYINGRSSSSFGGGWSDGKNEAIAEILIGEGVDITDIPSEQVNKIYKVEYGQLIDKTGHILGTDKVLVIVDYVNYHIRARHWSLNSNERFGLYKNNPLYDDLIGAGRDNPVICHKIFTTKSGLPIYDIDQILNKWS